VSFSLNPHNAPAVAEICRMLEGIPLAIELAAARVGTLSIEQISERLGGSLELLTRGGRTAVPRHRTLKGALGWSHELLPESERKVSGKLSIFAGGWTLEASEAVASGVAELARTLPCHHPLAAGGGSVGGSIGTGEDYGAGGSG
jgi:predicted ATPase